MRVHRLAFTVGGEPAPAGYQLRLSDDMFDQPPAHLEGSRSTPSRRWRCTGSARGGGRNSFGPLSERQVADDAELRERFFPDRSEEQLLPPSEPLPG